MAHDCEQGAELQLDEAERLSVHRLPREAVHRRLLRGSFEDGFTALALLYYFAQRGPGSGS